MLHNKIRAIKHVREVFGCDLKVAKDFIENDDFINDIQLVSETASEPKQRLSATMLDTLNKVVSNIEEQIQYCTKDISIGGIPAIESVQRLEVLIKNRSELLDFIWSNS